MTGHALDRTIGDPGEHTLVTKSGLQLHVRPVTLDDGPALASLFADLDADDLRFRFLSALRKVRPDQIAAMLEIDHREAEHLLAFVDGEKAPIASLMLVADAALESAEVAIVVDPEFQGRGVGYALLLHARNLARERGLHALRSIESRANHRALEVERDLGFSTSSYEGEPALVLVEARFD
jgi:acetyltransferase